MRLHFALPVDNWKKLKTGGRYIWLECGISTWVRVMELKEDGEWFGVKLEVLKSECSKLHKKGDTFDVGYSRGYGQYKVGEFYSTGTLEKIQTG